MCTQSEIKSRSSNKIARLSSDGQLTSNFMQLTCMNAKVCGHHCVFFCSPNLGSRVRLQGENLYSGRELADVRLPLRFWRRSRIGALKRNDQCTETCGDSSVTTVAWILGCSVPRTYWKYEIYTDFRSALPISIFHRSMVIVYVSSRARGLRPSQTSLLPTDGKCV